MNFHGRAAALASFILIAACATKPAPAPEVPAPPARPTVVVPIPPPTPPPAPIGRNAVETGIKLEQPRVLKADDAAKALAAFRNSCAAVITRKDTSGLTQMADWQPLCIQAASLDPTFAPGFFFYGFDWVKVGDGRAFATG